MEHLSLASIAAGGLLAGATYLDARYSITRDLKQLWNDRQWRQRLLAKVKALGDHTTVYHMMELCNPEDEALWFEGRTWSYDELKREVDALAEILWEHGVREGDFVAIMTTNSPEMVFVICALAKLGAAPAMVNTALRRELYFSIFLLSSSHPSYLDCGTISGVPSHGSCLMPEVAVIMLPPSDISSAIS